MSGPLEGIRVVEFAGLGPGPFCGMMLADHGAEVIRIDRIGATGLLQEPGREFTNRSRLNVAVDLKAPEGIALVRTICRSADAIIEGFRPGVMERLGLGPDVLSADNPRLVYGRVTGFGQSGPFAMMAGHDINYIALSGALHACGPSGRPPVPPLNLVGDFGGGGMMLAFGVLAAIISARATGTGQVIDCAMTDGSSALMAMIYSLRADGLWTDDRGANLLDGGAPFYGAYETADGKFIALGAIEPSFYRQMLALVGLADDPDMDVQDDRQRWPGQKAKLAAAFRARTRDEWCVVLENTDACFAPILSLDEAPHHKHNAARGTFVEVAGAMQPAPAPRFSRTPSTTPRPLAGGVQTFAPILHALGITVAELNAMQDRGILA